MREFNLSRVWQKEGRGKEIARKDKETGGLLSEFAELDPVRRAEVLERIHALRQANINDPEKLIYEVRVMLGQISQDGKNKLPRKEVEIINAEAPKESLYEKTENLTQESQRVVFRKLHQYLASHPPTDQEIERLLDWAEEEVMPRVDKTKERKFLRKSDQGTFAENETHRGRGGKRFSHESHGKHGRDSDTLNRETIKETI